ncbi:MAG: methyltransferase domain-containing protein [Myxococcota bacterium]|jgi:SAM-dependent methyltransferase|nr:methyltransferase domain-containing protein [Myxococcota bacterium]
MQIEELKRHWDSFGKKDPLWAILTAPGKRGGRWDVGEFFNSGVEEVRGVQTYLDKTVPGYRTRLALDFGCGVGRLTQALCAHFDRCVGVDIAPSMIQLANRFNLYGDRCEYRLNTAPDLSAFPDGEFDFIYSNIVLQHMAPVYSRQYMRDFVRLIAGGGYALFQVPAQLAESNDGRAKVEQLHRQAFRAALSAETMSMSASPGASFDILVNVRNDSMEIWRKGHAGDGRYLIQLGNHWYDADQRLIRFDDGRTPIPKDIAPGETVLISITVEVPKTPGTYILELDMVQEHVAWFGQSGSDTLRIIVCVAGLAEAVPTEELRRTVVPKVDEPAEIDTPHMEMHCVSRNDVVQIIEAAGGLVIDVQPSSAAGPAYLSYRYLVTTGNKK